MKRILKRSGSALVWAVCAMMVLTLIAASMLTLAAAYYDRTLEEAMQEKAQILAQSGANYAVSRLDYTSSDFSEDWVPINVKTNETASKKVYLSGGTTDDDEYVTLYFSAEESASNDEDKIESGEELRVYLLRVRSEAACGDSTASCSAVFWGYGEEDGIWNFAGFVQD